jgi:hypothetical protein
MRVRCGISIAAVAAMLAAAPSQAPAATSDAAATQAYLQADYQLVHVAAADIVREERAPVLLLGRVRSACPQAAAHSPQDPQSTQLSDEVIGAMVTAAYKPDLPAIRSFVSAVAGLHWSSGSLTREVHEYAGHLRVLAGLREPSLCSDVASWAASGFRTLPAATVSFDARFMPAWVGIGELFGRLSASETAQARALASRAGSLEARVVQAELNAVQKWGAIMNELELWP